MLSDLLPLMTDRVRHWSAPARNLFGKPDDYNGATEHAARVIYSPGLSVGPASKQELAEFSATIWLIDHPRAVAIGDTFTLTSSGEIVRVVRAERRSLQRGTLTKAYVK